MTTTVTPAGLHVETFEIEDASHSDASTMAADAAALELIEQLNLKGQLSILNAGTVTRLPYAVMEERELRVYKALFPVAAAVADYKAEAIPLRVLQVVAHAQQTELFHRLEVWGPKAATISDPLLVGITRAPTYPGKPELANLTTDTFYLLARWGKALLPFEQLEALATDLSRKARLAKLTQLAVEVKQAIEMTKESLDLTYLVKEPSAYGVQG